MRRIENPATEEDLTVGMNRSSDTTLLIFKADGLEPSNKIRIAYASVINAKFCRDRTGFKKALAAL